MENLVDFIQANIVLVAIFFVLLALVIGAEVQKLTKSYHDVSPGEAVSLINREHAALLDLREDSELASGTIANAKHLAFSVLQQRLDDLDSFKNTPLVAFCASGVRAPAACRLLKKNGFAKVYNLKGGVAAWEQANMPLAKK